MTPRVEGERDTHLWSELKQERYTSYKIVSIECKKLANENENGHRDP
jgi:hypothetical protein